MTEREDRETDRGGEVFKPHSGAWHIPTQTEVVVISSDSVVSKVIDADERAPRPYCVRTKDLEAI